MPGKRSDAQEEIMLSKATRSKTGKLYSQIMPPTQPTHESVRYGTRRPEQLPDMMVGPELFKPLPEEELKVWECV